jgi:hypothetical protein
MLHDLKIDPEYFTEVAWGLKKFELRKNDRDFKCEDILHLREYYSRSKKPHYSGRSLYCKVTYVLQDPLLGLSEGYCILSIDLIDKLNSSQRKMFTENLK